MAFPVNPIDNQQYTNALGTRYKYVAADGKWVIVSQAITGNQGVTGIQGVTGAQGYTGIIGETGASYGVTGSLSITFDGGGSEIIPDIKTDIRVPYSLQIDSWYVAARETGSILIGLWKSTYNNFPPTSADAMHAGATGPYIIAGIKNTGDTSDWSVDSADPGEYIRVSIDLVGDIELASLALNFHKI